MSEQDRIRWNEKYTGRTASEVVGPHPRFANHIDSIPPGLALDVACGLGAFPIWLAQRGWTVSAVDISPVALQTARELAARNQIHVDWLAEDLDQYTPPERTYDLISVSRYLDRGLLADRLSAALKPGGWLIYETFVAVQTSGLTVSGRNPKYVLQPGELPRLFSPLEVVWYEEEKVSPQEGMARLLARRPGSHYSTL